MSDAGKLSPPRLIGWLLHHSYKHRRRQINYPSEDKATGSSGRSSRQGRPPPSFASPVCSPYARHGTHHCRAGMLGGTARAPPSWRVVAGQSWQPPPLGLEEPLSEPPPADERHKHPARPLRLAGGPLSQDHPTPPPARQRVWTRKQAFDSATRSGPGRERSLEQLLLNTALGLLNFYRISRVSLFCKNRHLGHLGTAWVCGSHWEHCHLTDTESSDP